MKSAFVRLGTGLSGWTRVVMAPLLVVLTAAGLLLGAAPAQAAPAAGSGGEVAKTRFTMPLTVQRSGGAVTDSTGRGDCGLVYIEIIPTGGGMVRFEYGFESILGVVAQRGIVVRWGATNTGGPVLPAGAFRDDSLMISSRYDGVRPETTGPGNIIAQMDVVALLYNLTVCVGFVQDIQLVT